MAKRTNGEGTIYRRPDGLWRAEITLGYDADGKRMKKVIHSKELESLKKKVNDEKFKLSRNIITQNSDYTIAEWVQFWLENYKVNTLKPKTYDSYENALNRFIIPAFGKIKLNKIRPDSIQQLYNQLHKKGLSSTTIRIVHVTLSQAFDQAIKNDFIHTNPCKATVRPKSEKKKVLAMTPQQQDAFVQHCTKSTFHRFFVFLLNTGLRLGEAQSLTWQDIDFNKKIVSVNKTASVIVNRDEDADTKTKTVIDTAKTAHSMRDVPMNKIVENILRAQKSKSLNDVFVFSSSAGTLLSARNITRAYKIALEQVGLPDSFTVHSTRHTFATRLLEKNVNPKVVSDLLGHASVQITLDVYSHALPSIKSDAVNLLD